MTYEEALNKPLVGFVKDGKTYIELDDDWIETVDKALEKQIPKTPKTTPPSFDGYTEYICPCCGAEESHLIHDNVIGNEYKCCNVCGQRLDWGGI